LRSFSYLSFFFFLVHLVHTILVGVGGSIYTSHTLNCLKELGLDVQKAHTKPLVRLPSSYMPILCSVHINSVDRLPTTSLVVLDALLKNPVALRVLVWSRGRLVTLQILTTSSFSLVEETHSSLGQCVSFSFIDVGSGFTAYEVFLSLFFSFPSRITLLACG